jgi:integrase
LDTIHFTKAAIEALTTPAKRIRIKDAKQPGLCLYLTPAGKRTWYLFARIQGVLHERRLGDYPAFTVDQARQEAGRLVSELQRGIDSRKTRTAEPTLGEVWDWWREQHAKPRGAAKRLASDESLWRLHLAPTLQHRRLNTITRSDLRALHVELGNRVGTRTANLALNMVRAMWNKALLYETTALPNPADKLERFPEARRDRRLMPAEGRRFFEELAKARPDTRDFVLLSLYTGARRGNVQAMRWDQIDWEARTWRIPKTKNGKPQTIPLEQAELDLLRQRLADQGGETEWVFPSRRGAKSPHLTEPKRGWHALLKAAEIPDFHLHDLRRTLASFMADTGASLHVVGSALGHTSPAATAIYARLQLDPVRHAKRRALEAIDEARSTSP